MTVLRFGVLFLEDLGLLYSQPNPFRYFRPDSIEKISHEKHNVLKDEYDDKDLVALLSNKSFQTLCCEPSDEPTDED